jgi:hypothetical protein
MGVKHGLSRFGKGETDSVSEQVAEKDIWIKDRRTDNRTKCRHSPTLYHGNKTQKTIQNYTLH